MPAPEIRYVYNFIQEQYHKASVGNGWCFFMRRPVQGKQLLTQHTGRADEPEEKCLLPDCSRPVQGKQRLTQYTSRADELEEKCLLPDCRPDMNKEMICGDNSIARTQKVHKNY